MYRIKVMKNNIPLGMYRVIDNVKVYSMHIYRVIKYNIYIISLYLFVLSLLILYLGII